MASFGLDMVDVRKLPHSVQALVAVLVGCHSQKRAATVPLHWWIIFGGYTFDVVMHGPLSSLHFQAWLEYNGCRPSAIVHGRPVCPGFFDECWPPTPPSERLGWGDELDATPSDLDMPELSCE